VTSEHSGHRPGRLRAAAVIPARWASARLPGKPLLDQTGKPLIQHVWERVSQAECLDEALIATDDARIREAVEAFGGRCVMTRDDHATGTDRVAEVAAGLDADVIINVQGDEPEIDPEDLDRLVRRLESSGEDIATLARPLRADESSLLEDPNAVKVVFANDGRALYFSRSPIPHGDDPTGTWLHLGVYAFRRQALLEFAAAQPTELERRERLEQLRALDLGQSIGVVVTENDALGIDTADDYSRFVAHHTRSGARP
jgi:3-deoxy-manno-octulosonate cytidylyltransferase (CMP-KDO synthetase)